MSSTIHSSDSTLNGRDRGFWAGRLFSARAAINGAQHTVRTQPNAWIELAALLVVGAAGWYFRVSALEWGVLGLTIFVVLALECVNTAVEAVVDLVSPTYHPLAGVAKDAAAGGMVFAVMGSLCVAAGIFGPRLWGVFF
ncbi:MAG TPA: diacylglycerol kinase family protein [Chloroflexi bacterium]|nr:diacylglycerol kinase family protein [Chloroflexota bacterium]